MYENVAAILAIALNNREAKLKYLKPTLFAILIIAIILFSLWQISNSRTFQFFGGLVNSVNTKEKVVALTFDDGPTKNTDEILKILNSLNIKATFFVTGGELESNMEYGKKIVSAGHELGNHTYSHKRMVFKSPSFIKDELNRTDKLIREAGQKGDINFRPPHFKKLIILPYILNQRNTKTILGNIEPDSIKAIASDSSKMIGHVKNKIKPGSIILMHVMYDSRKESVKSITGMVTELKKEGYEFKTVSELLKYNR